MGIEAAVIAGALASARPRAGSKIVYAPSHPSFSVEDKVKELFTDLDIPYDMTGVEVLRDYLASLGKEDE